MKSREVLCKLLRLSLGTEADCSLPKIVDWREVFALSYREAVAALAVDGLQKLSDAADSVCTDVLDAPKLENLKYEWFGAMLQIEADHRLHNQRVTELARLFSKAGFRSCILKGQGSALLYQNPSLRQCGDIDIWVEGGRERVLEFIRGKFKVGDVVIHHARVEVFKDVVVEVHYMPAWLYNPIANKKLQRFFETESDAQFSNMSDCGFARPLPKFNLVFNAVHIYKHYFQKEFTLKNLVDYYCILQHSSAEDRCGAFCVLEHVGLAGFTSWLMGRLERDLGMSPELALCEASASESCCRPLGELISVLPWKAWHWFARKSF